MGGDWPIAEIASNRSEEPATVSEDPQFYSVVQNFSISNPGLGDIFECNYGLNDSLFGGGGGFDILSKKESRPIWQEERGFFTRQLHIYSS